MAKAVVSNSDVDLKTFTDCMYFINGHCKLNDKCRYRHCQEATAQTNNCFKWPKVCRDTKCPYRHPATPKQIEKKKKPIPTPPIINPIPLQTPPIVSRRDGLISFFWDIENVPIPKAHKPFDIVQRIRQKLVIEAGLREYSFSCYCNTTTISQENQLSLFHANVRIVHVPDRKPGAVDRQIMLELDRFERAHHPPATIVLISGDIDFAGKLSDLRHQAGFHVIVIHNKPAKEELKATVNAHFPWESFTQQAVNGAISSSEILTNEIRSRTPQPYRMNNQNNSGHLRQIDPSPIRSNPPPKSSRSSISKKKNHQCPKCKSEFESIQALRQHQEAKDHLFDCPICDESFPTLEGLIQHQEAKDHLFDCPICDESFRTLEGLVQHKKAKGHHEAEYKCGQCNRCFAKIESLNQHQQATNHNGLSGAASLNINGFVHGATPPSTLPNNNQVKNDVVQDVSMIIIQKGIDALIQYYPKIFPPNK
ncbi:unnamed protein product [Rotaria sp. Silwood2]|nr:unnamed protein product [Rotaria sp. Silwood2]CAF2756212.1 unnamed protein product [Rotaria sp. Silwood2]CAF2916362.1 unnamed protein product [Rotaria sp. Silwood2]CAF4124904.1 unnamed protein product [Rotaria sp. Silwood2]CAF4144996.1 unnamed protein product [Rotaria sp. Silwood2]